MDPSSSVRRRHVWVRSGGGLVYPGLVLAWRRTADGTSWEAHAAARLASVLTTWMPAADLTPVTDDSWQRSSPGPPVRRRIAVRLRPTYKG